MIAQVLGLAPTVMAFARPDIDWHAVSPELVLLAVSALLTLVDLIWLDRAKAITATLAGGGLLLALIPLATLSIDGIMNNPRVAVGDAYVVDGYSVVLKVFFILVGYVVVLLSTRYFAEGDYWESEYYSLLTTSILGMVVMTSARDLITIFVALELLSIPAYLLAAWRKGDPRSNEAGLKYYLMGVFASSIMLYGMSLVFGVTGTTMLRDISAYLSGSDDGLVLAAVGIVFVIVGFAFKVSAVPFHTWAPDTYEGAPTPVTAFLAVASKAAGFVALMNLVLMGFWARGDIYEPVMWVLAALSMTVGNLIALRQDNIIRLLAYSGIAQAGFMMAPLAVAGGSQELGDNAAQAIVTYLIIYAAMNLGAFAIILAVARRTRSGLIQSFNGLFTSAPVLGVLMTMFLASLAGIPPLGGWYAKLGVFLVLVESGSLMGYALAVIAAVNTVIGFGYYGRLAARIWVEQPDEEFWSERKPLIVPFPLQAALAICIVATVVFGTVGFFIFEDVMSIEVVAGP